MHKMVHYVNIHQITIYNHFPYILLLLLPIIGTKITISEIS